MYNGDVPSAGIVTGHWSDQRHECMIPKRGVKQILPCPKTRMQRRNENRLLCLVDSVAHKQADIFPDHDYFGREFYNQAKMSAAASYRSLPSWALHVAGGAYVPAMSDESVIVNGTAPAGGLPPCVQQLASRDT